MGVSLCDTSSIAKHSDYHPLCCIELMCCVPWLNASLKQQQIPSVRCCMLTAAASFSLLLLVLLQTLEAAMDELQRKNLIPLQKESFLCAAECCDKHSDMQALQQW
jgi:hypothetical protein